MSIHLLNNNSPSAEATTMDGRRRSARNRFRKILRGADFASCWFCRHQTQFVLFFSDGSEVFCCTSCLQLKGKIARLTRKYMLNDRSTILGLTSYGAQNKKLIVAEGRTP